MIHFWIGFYGWPVIIAATIFLNWYRITIRKKKPYYFAANYSRAVFGFACLVLMTVKDGFDPLGDLRTWISAILPTVYIVSSFYLFFDPGLSGLRGLKWNYRGKSSGLFDRMKIGFYYTLKVLCLAGLVWSLIGIL